jgi:hypothetical protein
MKLDHENIRSPYGNEGRVVTGGTVKYYLKDRLGSIREVMDDFGGIEESQMYYAYGKIRPLWTPAKKGREKFTGKKYDLDGPNENTNGIFLSYFGAR